MARPKKKYTKMNKNAQNSFEKIFNESIRKLKANEKAIEKAVKQVLTDEEIKISESEFNELKQLTDILNEIDKTIEEI